MAALRPMLAVAADESAHDRLLARGDLVFERKHDGIRALVEVTPAAGRRGGAGAPRGPEVRIWSRLGNDKTAQFPEVAGALAALAAELAGPIVLDGEIVAVDAAGRTLPFERMQGRMHRRGRPRPAAPDAAVVLVAFDLLRDGDEDLRPLPFAARRARLVERLDPDAGGAVRVVPSRIGGGRELRAEAQENDWEGLIVKDPASRYLSGRRHPGWRKLKLVRRQEFVVGGWTEGRSSRSGFGALLVGYHAGGAPPPPPPRGRAAARAPAAGRRGGVDLDAPGGRDSAGRRAPPATPRGRADPLVYAGHVGSGFTQADLDALGAHLHAIAADGSPFTEVPPANETPHWVEPSLVVEVKFTRWTVDGVLRHPVYLGVRADVAPGDVRREDAAGPGAPDLPPPLGGGHRPARTASRAGGAPGPAGVPPRARGGRRSPAARELGDGGARRPPDGDRASPDVAGGAAPAGPPTRRSPDRARMSAAAPSRPGRSPRSALSASPSAPAYQTPAASGRRPSAAARPVPMPAADPAIDALCEQLRGLEAGRKRGVLSLPDGARIPVGNLHKVFWPEPGLTKGDLVRFNLRMSPYLLPVVADRPLVMKRFPNGIDGKWFYQHRSPGELPEGVRVVTVQESLERGDTGVPYLIGGTLQTLAWMAQLAVISQDPWFSRLPDIAEADWAALDLDPMPEAPFGRVVEVARWLHDELDRLGVPCLAKTSGASGLHIYVPLPPGTPYEAGMIFCQIVATIVASRHPRAATVERAVRRRAADAVYIDYLQNIYGKTLAAAYSARASPFAGVSTPLTWAEVHEGLKTGLSPRDFTLGSVFDRLAEVGDLWAELRTGAPANLRAVLAGLEAD